MKYFGAKIRKSLPSHQIYSTKRLIHSAEIICRNSSSEMMAMPRFWAFSSFAGPILSPARMKEVLAD